MPSAMRPWLPMRGITMAATRAVAMSDAAVAAMRPWLL